MRSVYGCVSVVSKDSAGGGQQGSPEIFKVKSLVYQNVYCSRNMLVRGTCLLDPVLRNNLCHQFGKAEKLAIADLIVSLTLPMDNQSRNGPYTNRPRIALQVPASTSYLVEEEAVSSTRIEIRKHGEIMHRISVG